MGCLSLSPNPSTASSMKSFALLAALVAMASARSVQLKDIEYGICPGSNDPLDLNTLSIEPYPIGGHRSRDQPPAADYPQRARARGRHRQPQDREEGSHRPAHPLPGD